jgi:glycosyltransferase involved in cell wall biosynthesis
MTAISLPRDLEHLRVAIVHDYLNQAGGAEKVVEVFAEMFPRAPIYTSVYDADAMPNIWRTLDIRTSFMQRLTPRLRFAKPLVALYPAAFELFDLSEYDLVLSSTTAFAKAVVTRPETCHICYCNNPTRFVWMYHDYLRYERLPRTVKRLIPAISTPMRVWDFVAAQRPDFYVAGSYNAARRIAKYYRRESDVVQPPIDASAYGLSNDIADYFLVVSRLQPYKRIDVAIEACNRLKVPLRVIGTGPDRARLERLAGPTVQFLGFTTDEVVRQSLASCRAFLFPGEEDFGLTPVEAQASGRPVVAYSRGGALETVRPGVTGEFFGEQTGEALAAVLTGFDASRYDPVTIRKHAMTFDKAVFVERLYGVISRRYAEHQTSLSLNSSPLQRGR